MIHLLIKDTYKKEKGIRHIILIYVVLISQSNVFLSNNINGMSIRQALLSDACDLVFAGDLECY